MINMRRNEVKEESVPRQANQGKATHIKQIIMENNEDRHEVKKGESEQRQAMKRKGK